LFLGYFNGKGVGEMWQNYKKENKKFSFPVKLYFV